MDNLTTSVNVGNESRNETTTEKAQNPEVILGKQHVSETCLLRMLLCFGYTVNCNAIFLWTSAK